MTTQTITLPENILSTEFLRLVRFRDIQNGWSVFSGRGRDYSDTFPLISLGDVMKRSKNVAIIQDGIKYRRLTIKLYTKGVGIRDEVDGKDIGTKNQWFVKAGQFIISKIDARNGAFGIVPTGCDGAIATNDFPAFDVDNSKMLTEFLQLISGTEHFRLFCENASTGTTGRRRVDIGKLLDAQIPLPDIETQARIVKSYHDRANEANTLNVSVEEKAKEIEWYLIGKLGIEIQESKAKNIFGLIRFKDLERWDSFWQKHFVSSNAYPVVSFSEIIHSGPHYGANTKAVQRMSDTRYIRITDINEDGTLNDEIVSAEEVEEKYVLKENDFLLARSGNTVWKSFLYKSHLWRCIYAGYLVKYDINDNKVVPEFLLAYTKSKTFKHWISLSQRIAGQPNINGQEYLKAPIILPPLSIQSEIVEHLEIMKNEISQAKKQAKELRENAKKEFEAELFGIS